MNNKQSIKIEVPDETTKKMLKNKWINNAVGVIADVVTWMQEDIDKWLSQVDNKEEK